MSIKVISDVMRDPRYDGKQKLILVAIANAVNHDGVGFASHQQIQQVTDVSSRYIRDCIAGFVADGRLEIVRKGVGRGNATVYRVLPRVDATQDKRGTTEHLKGEVDAPVYVVDEDIKGELRDTKRGTPAHQKGELEDAKRGTPAPVKGELGDPKRGTPPSSPPSFTSLDTSSLEAPSLETSPFLGADLVNPPRRKASRRLHSVREDSPTQVDLSGQKEITFEQFWQAYPRKVGKGKAREAYAKALRITDPATLTDQARRYAQSVQGKDQQYVAHPTTWLNQERWEDVYPDHGELPDGWYRRPDGNLLDPVGTLWGEMPGGRLVAL